MFRFLSIALAVIMSTFSSSYLFPTCVLFFFVSQGGSVEARTLDHNLSPSKTAMQHFVKFIWKLLEIQCRMLKMLKEFMIDVEFQESNMNYIFWSTTE